jgi:hypothetical protein
VICQSDIFEIEKNKSLNGNTTEKRILNEGEDIEKRINSVLL